MRFPLEIHAEEHRDPVIRTLLAINEVEQSITFAGDIPEGARARLMKPSMDSLMGGAGQAVQEITRANHHTGLGLVVSCVGRRIVMKEEVEEELEQMEAALGERVQLTGFYSYGEIAPLRDRPQQCQLHNQTVVLTTIYEP